MEDEVSQEIRAICLRFLTRREHSQLELLNKLSDKGYARAMAQTVVSQLAEQGLQSDVRFLESYTRHRIMKGFGPVRIKSELQQKGIDEDDYQKVVEEISGSWSDLLKMVYRKKFEQAGQLNRREWAKRSRFLQQRGFPIEMIMNLFKELGVKLK